MTREQRLPIPTPGSLRPWSVGARRELEDAQHALGLTYGAAPVPLALEPLSLPASVLSALRSGTALLHGVLHRALQLVRADPSVRGRLSVDSLLAELARVPGPRAALLPIVRADYLLTAGAPAALEFNTDSPAGAGHGDLVDLLGAALWGRPDGAAEGPANGRRARLWDEALALHREQLGRTPPRVALLVSGSAATTLGDVRAAQRSLRERGVPARVTTPDELDYRRGVLYASGAPVNLVVRRCTLPILEPSLRARSPLRRAVEEGAICLVNPLASALAGNKEVLALMHDPEFQALLRAPQLEAIRRLVPWTCRLGATRVTFEGRRVSPLDLAARQRERFVLKPSRGRGGADVLLGDQTSAERWERALSDHAQSPRVLQLRAAPSRRRVTLSAGERSWIEASVNLGVFSFGGRHGGVVARLSADDVVNVARGGGLAAVRAERS